VRLSFFPVPPPDYVPMNPTQHPVRVYQPDEGFEIRLSLEPDEVFFGRE